MAYYGVSYRGGARNGLGFQRPQPSPDQGGRAPPRRPGRQGAGAGGRRGGGKLADILKDAAEQAAKQWAKDRFARYLWNQFSPWRRAKFTARIAKYLLMDGPPPFDDLIPWREEQPQRFEVVGRPADAFYDCPSVNPPYDAVVADVTTGGSTIPDPWKCLGGQIPKTGDVLPDGAEVSGGSSDYTGAVIIGPGSLWLDGRYRRMTFDLIWRWDWKKGQDGQWLPKGRIRHHAAQKPLYLPSPAPWFTPFPDDAPILQPTPQPRHIPYPKVPGLPDSPWPQGRKTAQPDNRTPPYLPPYADPEAGPGLETDGGGLKPAPPHVFLPPGPGQKEKKGRLRGGPLAAKMIADALGGLMEGADWIDAAWRALPKDKRCKASTPQAKLECLWKNLDHLDMAQFVANALVMEASDRLQGYVGRALAKASRRAGFQPGRGLQTGGAATRYAQQAAADLLKGL